MSDSDDVNDTVRHEVSTRRETIKYGGTLATVGLLAGCTGSGGGGTESTEATSGDGDDSGESTAKSKTDESEDDEPESTSYEACIEPAACLTFEEVPETYAVYNGGWADMAFALGQREGFLTAGNMIPRFFFEPFGLDVPPQDELPSMWSEGGWDKESFYELDPDVFLIDPNYLHGTGWDSNWDESDTREINDNVAPFFGNNCRRRRDFHDYKLYTLYEAFDRLADLFQERERYEAFVEIHDELQTEIADRLPPPRANGRKWGSSTAARTRTPGSSTR